MSKSKNYQKFLTATVATAVVASTAATVVPYNVEAASFKDVVTGTYYYDAVSNLSEQGVINGFEDGTFKPYQNATRGQAAALIARALKLDGTTVKDPGFKDVRKEAFYYTSVAALANAGIINGVTKESYEPNRLVTRAEMAKMIANAFKLKENNNSASKFKDVPANSWYAGFVGALAENGITIGKTETSFDPSNNVNRAQVATFIYRAKQKQVLTNVVSAVTDSSVTINGTSYKIADNLKGLFNSANSTVLKGARIAFDQSNGTITGVKGLEITASGKAASAGQSEQSGDLVLDGKGAVINGYVTINGDYVSVKNLTVKGDFTIGSSVKNSFFSDKLVVEGKTIVAEDVKTASVNAAAVKKIKIIFTNSTLKIVEVSKKDVAVETKGSTKVTEITVSSNASISADSTSVVPKVTLQDGVINVEINGAVGNLTIISKNAITISGNATIEKVQINQSGAVTLNTTGEIKQIESKNKDSQITIKEGTKVGNVVVPQGSDVKDIIQNYDQVKEDIAEVGGETNPDAGTPPVGGGGGGGGGNTDNTAPVVTALSYETGGTTYTATNTDGVYTINVPSGEVSTLDNVTLKIEDQSPIKITANGTILGYQVISSQLDLTPNSSGVIDLSLTGPQLTDLNRGINVWNRLNNDSITVKKTNIQKLLDESGLVQDNETSVTFDEDDVIDLFNDTSLEDSLPNNLNGEITIAKRDADLIYTALNSLIGDEVGEDVTISTTVVRLLLTTLKLPQPEELTVEEKTVSLTMTDSINPATTIQLKFVLPQN